MKEIRHAFLFPTFLVLGIIGFLGMAVFLGLYFGYLRPTLAANASKKEYLLPKQSLDMPAAGSTPSTIPSFNDVFHLNSSREESAGMEDAEALSGSGSSESAEELETYDSTTSTADPGTMATEQGALSDEQKALIAMAKAKKAEVEKVLAEGEAIRTRAMGTVS